MKLLVGTHSSSSTVLILYTILVDNNACGISGAPPTCPFRQAQIEDGHGMAERVSCSVRRLDNIQMRVQHALALVEDVINLRGCAEVRQREVSRSLFHACAVFNTEYYLWVAVDGRFLFLFFGFVFPCVQLVINSEMHTDKYTSNKQK